MSRDAEVQISEAVAKAKAILAGPPPEGTWVTSEGKVYGSRRDLNPVPNVLAELVAEIEIGSEKAQECIDWLRDETLPLIRELCDDLKRFYEPDKGWPPHISRALDLGDDEQTVADLEAIVRGGRGR